MLFSTNSTNSGFINLAMWQNYCGQWGYLMIKKIWIFCWTWCGFNRKWYKSNHFCKLFWQNIPNKNMNKNIIKMILLNLPVLLWYGADKNENFFILEIYYSLLLWRKILYKNTTQLRCTIKYRLILQMNSYQNMENRTLKHVFCSQNVLRFPVNDL